MTNFEYWKDRILEIIRSDSLFGLFNGEVVDCHNLPCDDCGFSGYCTRKRFEWLYSEYIDRPKLTKKERAFCELVETGWLARDKDGSLYFYDDKPYKEDGFWRIKKHYVYINPFIFPFEFSFIKFEDKEPWSVEDLLKLEVEE